MTTIYRQKLEPARIPDLIFNALPDQGCIEIQRDVPGKEHAWHTHETDETIVVLDGSYASTGSRASASAFRATSSRCHAGRRTVRSPSTRARSISSPSMP